MIQLQQEGQSMEQACQNQKSGNVDAKAELPRRYLINLHLYNTEDIQSSIGLSCSLVEVGPMVGFLSPFFTLH